MNNKLILSILLGIFLIGSVLATTQCDGTYLGTFKQGETINLRQICDTCTYVTLGSVTYPNSTLFAKNVNMTKSGIDYTYPFKITVLGDHYYTVYGNKGGSGTILGETFCFGVTPTGFVGTLGFYIVLLVLSLTIIIIGYSVEDAWVVIFGAFGFILLGLFILLYGIDGMKDSYYTYGFGIITIMLGAYFGIRGAFNQAELD